MLVVAACLIVLILAASFHLRRKQPPLDREVIRRIRRFADQSRREQLLPYE